MNILCPICSTTSSIIELPSLADFDKHNKSGHTWFPDSMKKKKIVIPAHKRTLDRSTGQVVESEDQKLTQSEKPAKLKLTYKYQGSCSVCMGSVATLLVKIDKEHVAVAWCNKCQKQIDQQKVKPL